MDGKEIVTWETERLILLTKRAHGCEVMVSPAASSKRTGQQAA